MATYTIFMVLAVMVSLVQSQRPFFAGSRSIGYPDVEPVQRLSNRFGEDDEPLPVQAKGDRQLVNTLRQMPVDKQPFWYLNAQQYEAMRNQPQTWPQKSNIFIEK